MEHDKFCFDADPNHFPSIDFNGNNFSCQCEFINMIREEEHKKAFRYGYLVGWSEGREEGRKTDPVTQWLADHLRQDMRAQQTFDQFANGSSQNAENPKYGGGDDGDWDIHDFVQDGPVIP
jgi:hypothetical protein